MVAQAAIDKATGSLVVPQQMLPPLAMALGLAEVSVARLLEKLRSNGESPELATLAEQSLKAVRSILKTLASGPV